MDVIVLDDIPFEVDQDHLIRQLHIGGQPDYVERLRRLVTEALPIARPRAMYRPAYVESRGPREVVLDGVTLSSRVLRVNLEDVHRTFPYVATCGVELHQWSASITDMLEQFWADTLMELALRQAMRAMEKHIARHHHPGRASSMSPGSLEDWPLDQQRALFELLGDPRATVGVELTESCLMVPIKSVSGIRFPTETSFESCQLCPRDPCPGRRAPYDPGLYESRYAG